MKVPEAVQFQLCVCRVIHLKLQILAVAFVSLKSRDMFSMDMIQQGQVCC